jgi:hypothetical protein
MGLVLIALAAIIGVLVPMQTTSAAPTLSRGDVLISIGGGKIEQHSPDGTLIRTLDDTTGTEENDGMCFDPSGNLYANNGFSDNSLSKFDPTGALVAARFIDNTQISGDNESCVVDSAGNIYLGLPDSSPTAIQKYSSAGTLLETLPVTAEDRGSDWLELAADQCTLFYTSEGDTVFRYNACTHTQLTPFATSLPGPCFANRLLTDGSMLVACESAVVKLSTTGTIATTFSAASLGLTGGFIFAMNLDPDGTTFWTADYETGKVARANISDGAVVGGFTASDAQAGPYGGLTVVGEITQAQPTTTTTAAPTTSSTTPPAQAVQATAAFTG